MPRQGEHRKPGGLRREVLAVHVRSIDRLARIDLGGARRERADERVVRCLVGPAVLHDEGGASVSEPSESEAGCRADGCEAKPCAARIGLLPATRGLGPDGDARALRFPLPEHRERNAVLCRRRLP